MSWPSRFGTLGEKVFGPNDPFNECDSFGSTNAASVFSSDEMEPVKHPLFKPGEPGYGKMFTSKAEFRRITKEKGGEEIGTAYDHGYDPQPSQEREQMRAHQEKFHQVLSERRGQSTAELRRILRDRGYYDAKRD